MKFLEATGWTDPISSWSEMPMTPSYLLIYSLYNYFHIVMYSDTHNLNFSMAKTAALNEEESILKIVYLSH